MIEFAYPWMIVALPAPLLVYWLMPPHREVKASVRVPFFQRLVDLTGEVPSHGAVVLQRLLSQRLILGMAWLLIVAGLAKPELVGDPVTRVKSARDLMVAVDISGSMDNPDWLLADSTRVTRLEGVRQVLALFVEQREHDRLGLIVFGDSPYLQAPFTEDHRTFLALLDETEVGMAGQSTMLGDAVGLAIKLFEASDTRNRVLIVLTDGNDTGSRVPPIEAAKVARERDVRIYNIAIGDPETTGEQALDLDTLERMAQITAGASYQAMNNSELAAIYEAIAALEPDEYETLTYRPRTSLHYVPIAVFTGLYTILFLILALLAQHQRRADTRAAIAQEEVRSA